MGHDIRHHTFEFKISTSAISSMLNEEAKRNGDCGTGLEGSIRFKDLELESYDKAVAYVDSIDKTYLQIAVSYFEYPNTKNVSKPKSLIEATEACNELHQIYYHEKDKRYYSPDTVKSQYLGCKNCGSRLAVKYIYSNRCPLCGAELRPETELKRIEALKVKYDKAFARCVAEQEKYEALVRKANKPVKMWYTKTEYHT